MLSAVRLRNFRSLEDTGEVQLRPLVLLVGANSSGKSSFLRFFPLLRQTAFKNASSPLLWFGDDVDFGDFERVLGASADPVIEVTMRQRLQRDGKWITQDTEVVLTSRIAGDREHSWIERCTLEVFGHRIVMELGPRGQLRRLSVDEHEFPFDAGAADAPMLPYPGLELVPIPHELTQLNAQARQRLTNTIEGRIHGRTRRERIDAMVEVLRSGVDWDVHGYLQRIGPESWNQYISSLRASDPYISEIGRLLVARDLRALLEDLAMTLNARARLIGYVGPFRSAPLRYHRKQDLAVDRISSDGENLAMFLRSLDEADRADFSKFVSSYFGFGVRVEQEGQHWVLMVEVQGRLFNLIDMGFGMSQVLPIVAQCWLASRALTRKGGQSPLAVASLLAIEQPELHLHPMHQANLADMLSGVLRAERDAHRWIPLVIETHSNAMINRLGELVSEGQVLPTEVSVLLFEKGEDGVTRVREASFNSEGVLENWPVGFLSA